MISKTIAHILLAGVLLCLSGCGPSVSVWRNDAHKMLLSARQEGAPALLPQEYASLNEAFSKGDSLLKDDEVEDADQYFQMAFLKGALLRENLAAVKKIIAEEDRKRREEARWREEERLQALAREEEEKRITDETAAPAWAAGQARAESSNRSMDKGAMKGEGKERPLPTQHTVKRGETLPQISAQTDVYGDSQLWPLLYRANRDQIRDPRTLWPGQTLRIPRYLSKEEIQEARRYAQERRLH